MDDPSRFPYSDQAGAYLGLAPSVYPSGDIDYRGRITQEGNDLLRWRLAEAAHNLLSRTRRDCASKRWSEKLAVQKSRHLKNTKTEI
ncbi:MAG: transposase [Gammaproteobacteria bacterium]